MTLANMDSELLVRSVFCFENNSERDDDHISRAHDSIGLYMLVIGLFYNYSNFLPKKIESNNDEIILCYGEDIW